MFYCFLNDKTVSRRNLKKFFLINNPSWLFEVVGKCSCVPRLNSKFQAIIWKSCFLVPAPPKFFGHDHVLSLLACIMKKVSEDFEPNIRSAKALHHKCYRNKKGRKTII